MKIARFFGGIVALCALVAVALLYAGKPAHSFELQDSPATVARPGAGIKAAEPHQDTSRISTGACSGA